VSGIYLDVPAQESELVPLPEDRELLSAMVRTLLAERSREEQRAAEQAQHAGELRVGGRHLANFENLPVTTRVHERSAGLPFGGH
jgi:hypothetical protein